MSLCNETPRSCGKTDRIELKGGTYSLSLAGTLMTREQWAGSEYYERIESVYWFEGEGSIKKKGRRPLFFRFVSSAKQSPLNTLKDGVRYELEPNVLGTTDNWRDYFEYDPRQDLVPERMREYIDAICEHARADLKGQAKRGVPKLRFPVFAYQDLVRRGIVFGPKGQVELPLAAA